MSFFTKVKRAQSDSDFETWMMGGAVPTLNRMDNNGEAFATVLIIDGTRVNDVRVYEDGIVPTVISRYGTGGGNVPMIFPIQDGRDIEKKQNGLGIGTEQDPSYTLDTTGGQVVAYSIREDAKANNFSATETNTALTIQSHQPSPQSHHAQLFIADAPIVRRLTPRECERLQGFPDDWTEGQADSSRYKQMGNAVAVPVVEWIVNRLVKSV